MFQSSSCSDRLNPPTVEPEVFRNMTEFQLPAEYSTFDHSVRLQFPKFSRGFSCSDFKPFIQEQVGEECVVSLGRLAFPNEWQLQVNNVEVREKLIRMQKTKINMRTCWISPLSQSEVRGHIHWLPTEIPEATVSKVLTIYGEVLFVEKQPQTKFDNRINSDMMYFALFLRSGKTIDDISHFIRVGNFLGFISIRGRAPVCFHCRVVGHRKSECKAYYAKLNGYCSNRPGRGRRTRPRGRRFKTEAKIEALRLAEQSIVADTEQSMPSDEPQVTVEAMELGNGEPEGVGGVLPQVPLESTVVEESPCLPAESVPNPIVSLCELEKNIVETLTTTAEVLNERIEVTARFIAGEVKSKKKKRKQKKKHSQLS